jgi:hypothetical protein
MAWLDRALRSLLRATHPRGGMEAAADARAATRSLAATLGDHEVPFGSVERRLDALIRLDVPTDDALSPQRRKLLGDQLRHWASEAYAEARLRLRRPDDLP